MRILFIGLLVIWCQLALASPSDENQEGKAPSSCLKYPVISSLGINIGFDYVASSMTDDILEPVEPGDRIKVNTSLPFNFNYRFSFTNPKIPHYLKDGYQGISVGVLNFGALQSQGFSRSTKNIGYPILVYIFQGGPFYRINTSTTLNYEWNFGAACGWKPYSEENKNFNLRVGSRVNAYLHLALTVNYRINPTTSIFAGLGVSHFSNGNTSFPNPGVNSFGLRAGMVWTLNHPSLKDITEISQPDSIKRKKLNYDLLVWGASRKRVYRGEENPVLLPGHFACAGISFSPMANLNTWWRAGGSLDIQWDQSSDMKRNYISGTTTSDIFFTTPSFWRQLTVGISAHGELRMPIFGVNIGCGYNFVSPPENRGSYQNISLKTYICENLFINIGYQLRNFHQQSSLMLGAGVSI